jgi:hypothetical protein
METLADPSEANKLFRLQQDLRVSHNLTEVADEFHLFEIATNKHFNEQMNNEQSLEDSLTSRAFLGKAALADLSMTKGLKQPIKPTVERYDRMTRKDFSRKPNSFVPVLMNDNYSNFRFSKRATDVLSPLNSS